MRKSKDPTVFTVLFEDTAAILGLIVAFAGITLGHALDMPVLDGVASLVIGLILGTTAVVLAYESKELLIGEAVSGETLEGIGAILREYPGIKAVNDILTMHLGPRDVLLNISLDFEDELSSSEVEDSIARLEYRIKKEYPDIRRVFIEAKRWTPEGEY